MNLYTAKNPYRVIRRKLAEFFILSTAFLLYAYSSGRPVWTEETYSRDIYPAVISVWSGITSLFSFSAAEIIVYIIALCAVVRIVRGTALIIHEPTAPGRAFYFVDLLLSGAVAAALICFLFITLWGLNYNRLPFSESSGLDAAPATVRELEQSCALLAVRAGEFREQTHEDDDGLMALSVPLKNTLERANDGFRAASAEFAALGCFEPGRPKPVLSSKFMSYAGITGIYFPITAEANINTDVTDAEIPFTICHELAHQLGYAREDEANFISWIACVNSPYEDYRYSGALMALTHSLNALYTRDAAAWNRIRSACSPAVNGDLNATGRYWQAYEGPVSEISETINDTFLRTNGQTDGVQSYGRMVDLIIAYFNADGLLSG